jgi:hypothetical protein
MVHPSPTSCNQTRLPRIFIFIYNIGWSFGLAMEWVSTLMEVTHYQKGYRI